MPKSPLPRGHTEAKRCGNTDCVYLFLVSGNGQIQCSKRGVIDYEKSTRPPLPVGNEANSMR
eukprot:10141231-Lingulodinium_polyedra.AAC.1